MPEPTSLIKNPLTIIAAFATLAEVSGTAVLPLINSTNQFYFMCFLMTFPTILVILFFVTLNFNHHVLYAPSDFKDEENYFKRFSKSSPLERSEKIRQEVQEIHTSLKENTPDEKSEPLETKSGPDVKIILDPPPTNNFVTDYERAEHLAIRKLAQEWPHPVIPQMRLDLNNGRKIVADAASVEGTMVTLFEIRYYGNEPLYPAKIQVALMGPKKQYNNIPDDMSSRISVTLIIVTDHAIPHETQEHIVDTIQNDPKRLSHLGRILFYDVKTLAKEFKSR